MFIAAPVRRGINAPPRVIYSPETKAISRKTTAIFRVRTDDRIASWFSDVRNSFIVDPHFDRTLCQKGSNKLGFKGGFVRLVPDSEVS
jgi:hypothetical protein